MENTNAIGLPTEKADKLAKDLNKLLADYSIFYMNTRGFHWNIQGDQFFELHEKFEELYTGLAEKIDEVAERILTLGKSPVHAYSKFIEMAEISEILDASGATETVNHVLDAFKKLIVRQRNILQEAADIGDEGTADLMNEYIKEQEKMTWMYTAYLK